MTSAPIGTKVVHKSTRAMRVLDEKKVIGLCDVPQSPFVVGRSLPDNTIVFAERNHPGESTGWSELVSVNRFSLTSDEEQVVGYENPSIVKNSDDSWTLYCNQLYPSHLQRDWVDGNIVSFRVVGNAEGELFAEGPPQTVLSPDDVEAMQLAQKARLGQQAKINLVKDPKVFTGKDGRTWMLFQFNDGGSYPQDKQNSHIGICEIIDGRAQAARPLLTAHDDIGDHVGPIGAPVDLDSGDSLLFYNRGFNIEGGIMWGVTTALIENSSGNIIHMNPEYVVGSKRSINGKPSVVFGSQIINYARWPGSCKYLITTHDDDGNISESHFQKELAPRGDLTRSGLSLGRSMLTEEASGRSIHIVHNNPSLNSAGSSAPSATGVSE